MRLITRPRFGFGTRTLFAGLALAVAAACVPRETTAEATPADDLPMSSSPLGQYLAGIHAERTNDLSAAADFLSNVLATDPDNRALLLETYLLLVGEGRFDEAVPLAKRIVEFDPVSPHAWLTLAVNEVHEGNFAAADEYLASLPVDGANRVIVPLIGAWIALETAGIEEAASRIEKLRLLEGAEPLRRMHLGLLHEVERNTAEAAAIYDELAADPALLSLREVQVVGNFRQRQGDIEGARALYDAYVDSVGVELALEPAYEALDRGTDVEPVIATVTEGIAEGFFDVGFLLQRQQAADTATVLTRKAIYLRPDFAVAKLFLADSLATKGRYDDAIEAYRSVTPNSGFDWQARLEAARTLDFIDRTDEAIEELEAMIDERPDRPDAAQLLGTILRGRERFEEAIPYYDIAVERIGEPSNTNWPLFYFRGIVLERTKQWERAEADFLTALELEPEQPYVMNYLAYSWIEFGENYDEALDMLIRAVELRPEDGYIVDSLGWVYYRLGDYDNAVIQLERAVALTPLDPTINDHLGDAYWQVGRRSEARFQWQRALSFDPDDELRPVIESKLERGLTESDRAETQTGG